MPVDEDRLHKVRGYLADYLGDEDFHGDESLPWFHALGDHVEALPLDDPRLAETAEYAQPFLDDDDRIECGMYPDGAAVRYLEDTEWGGDHDAYFSGFVDALRQDWQRWQRMLADHGDASVWRQDTNEYTQTEGLSKLAIARGHW